MKRNEIYKKITDQIIAKLNAGTVPWEKSWVSGVPRNMVSGKSYRGINFLSLITHDFPSPQYLTFTQCHKLGGTVSRNEKGSLIVFWKIVDRDAENDLNFRQVPLIKYSYVFNISQTSLYKADVNESSFITCEQLLSTLKNIPAVKHNYRRCYYDPVNDFVSVPVIRDFESGAEYYSSLWHELIHSTGHPNKLNRFNIGDLQETAAYSEEELVAELGSSFLSGMCGLSNKVINNQVAYIQGWLSKLGDDPNIIVRAAQKAKQAISYILTEE